MPTRNSSPVESADHHLGVLRSLAVKRGLSPAALDPDALALLLTACVQTMSRTEQFSEKAFNQQLSDWLQREGRMLRTDFAEWRRTLVDLQFCQRDGYGRVYQRAAAWPAAWQALCTAVGSTDLNALLVTAQNEDATRRVERKRRALAAPQQQA
jgi:hypothetical protein